MVDYAEIDRKLESLRNLHIASARDEEFQVHLQRLLKRGDEGQIISEPVRYTRKRETRGVLVLDEPGGGKTTLVERGLRKMPALEIGPHGHARYVASIVPSPATFKSMAMSLLEVTGYPMVNPRREAWSIWHTVRERLAHLGVTVLWIDEAHDLFCADRKLILRGLKYLMQGENALIVVLSGTMQLGEIIRSDTQVKRRFSMIVLSSVSEQADGKMFTSIISSYCNKAGLTPPDEPDLVGRLFRASRFRFGRAVETLIGAIERALLNGADALDMQHFAEYWAIQEACSADGNIFHAENWWDIHPDEPIEENPPEFGRRRKNAA